MFNFNIHNCKEKDFEYKNEKYRLYCGPSLAHSYHCSIYRYRHPEELKYFWTSKTEYFCSADIFPNGQDSQEVMNEIYKSIDDKLVEVQKELVLKQNIDNMIKNNNNF